MYYIVKYTVRDTTVNYSAGEYITIKCNSVKYITENYTAVKYTTLKYTIKSSKLYLTLQLSLLQ